MNIVGGATIIRQARPVPRGVVNAPGMITNVTGTVSNGSTLTITGSPLMDVDNTNWYPFFKTANPLAWKFGSASRGLDGYATSGPGSDGTYISGLISGGHTCEFHTTGDGMGPCPDTNTDSYNAMQFTSGQEQWVGAYFMYDRSGIGWPNDHIKLIDTCCNLPFRYYWQPSPAADGTTLPSTFSILTDIRTDVSIPGGQLQLNRWYWTECHFKGDAPTHIECWMDGQKIVDMTGVVVSGVQDFMEFGIVNACSNIGIPWDITNRFGGFVTGTARIYPFSQIEIDNSPSFPHPVWQAPLSLSDTSIQVTCALGGLTGPYYLRVTNNKRVVSNTWSL